MNPSLLLIPDRYKASKLYSQIPDTGAGDLDFTRALDTATRVGPDGLIEKVRTNLVLRSQEFDNATWTKININVTANSTTAPNGTLTADTILSPLSLYSAAFQTISSEGAMTLSVFAKANTSNFIALTIFDVSPAVDYTAIFDLSNGTFVGNGEFSSVDSFSIEDAANGWYRLSITKNVGAVGNHNYVIGVANGNSTISLANTSVFVWGCQLEASDFGATPYIPTTTAAVSVGMLANIPRIDYTGGGCGKLLVEPAATNLVLRSEEFDNASWTKTRLNAFGSGSIANAITAPDGTTSADYIQQETGQTNGGLVSVILSISGAHSWSVFAKAEEFEFLAIRTRSATFTSSYFNLTNGTVALVHPDHSNVQITSFGNGWYKCSLSDAGGALANRFSVGGRDGANDTVTPDRGVYIWGAQLETGSVATSYIPTLAAAVTRSADVCNKTSIASLIGQTEGTLYAEVSFDDIGAGGASAYVYFTDGSFNNAVIVGREPASPNSKFFFFIQASSVNILENTANNITSGVVKMAVAYKSGDWAAFLNGNLVASGSTTFTFNASMSRFGVGPNNGAITVTSSSTRAAQALLFKTRLSNAQLASLTA